MNAVEKEPSIAEAKALVADVVAASGLVPSPPRDDEPFSNEPSRALSAFSSEANYLASVRMAKALSQSSLVPAAYQGTGNIPNVLIAMELANRIGASVFMVMQNLDIIHGRPSWRAQFLIATVNSSGRFTPLRFRWQGSAGSDDWGCRATAKDRSDGEPCIGPLITIAVAKAEGWMGKSGSKWKTLPELMMMYRAAAFWTRTYAPELSLGMHTAEEAADIRDDVAAPGFAAGDTKALEAELRGRDTTRIPMPDASPAPATEVRTMPQTPQAKAAAEASPDQPAPAPTEAPAPETPPTATPDWLTAKVDPKATPEQQRAADEVARARAQADAKAKP